jgi:RimJ/RimL family protein N-acetyltransferase
VQAPTLTAAARGGTTLTLRAHRDGDAAFLVELMSQSAVTDHLADLPQPYRLGHAQAFIAQCRSAWREPETGEQALIIEVDGRPVGQLGVRVDGRVGEIGYVLAPPFQGRGVMSAALRRFGEWALHPDGADLLSLTWRAVVGNWASRRVAWACGYRFAGTVAGLLTMRGGVRDAWIASLGRDDPTHPATPWLDAPQIVVGDTVLRANVPADDQRIADACSDPRTVEYLPALPRPYLIDDARRFLAVVGEQAALGRAVSWAIAATDNPTLLLGEVAVSGLGAGHGGEIGYWLHPDARGRGHARVAVRAAARHCLIPAVEGGLGLDRVLIRVAEPNTPSAAVARSAGFTLTGRDRSGERLRDGRTVDFLRFDLLAEELAAVWAHPAALR